VRRVLVTGATGFVGRHTLEPLRARGFEVHGVGSSDCDLLAPHAAAELVARLRPTHLLHLAWTAEPGAFWASPENIGHVGASLALVRAFAEAGGRRAVLAGTCAEYDWAYGFCSAGTTPLAPATLYGAAKDALRRVAEAYCATTGVELAWGRIFFAYGPHEHPARLVSSVARALLAGEEALCTSGEQVRDFLHVADVAGAFAHLVDSELEGPVDVCSGEPLSVRSLVEEVAVAAGRPDLLRLGALPPRPDEPPLLVGDARRLQGSGFRPSYGVGDGVADAVGWWRTSTSVPVAR
jgi:nucleoside-diphosphate-sugar epimerase